MICVQYRIKTGKWPNLQNPERFTEKLQWYKLNYKNPELIRCVDKYDVREYVKEKGLQSILIPCIGIYDSVESINWDKLPPKYVMKDTLGGGGNSVIIVNYEKAGSVEWLRKTAKRWTEANAHSRGAGREWPYYSGKNHRILFEKYIEADVASGGLVDYKFFCFHGKVRFLYVIADRQMGSGAGVGIYNSDFERLPVRRKDERSLERVIQKPDNFEEMKAISETLASDFPEVRVDLYNQKGKIFFGELTFYDGSGYMQFDPDDFDYQIGKFFTV
jgi:hypothetical protein